MLAALAKVSEDDPGVVDQFYPAAVAHAVARANTNMPQLATWMQGAGHYPIPDSSSRILFVSICAKPVAVRGRVLFAPNTLQQAFLINQRISSLITSDAFLIAICGPANCHPIARLYTFADHMNAARAGGATVAGVEVFD